MQKGKVVLHLRSQHFISRQNFNGVDNSTNQYPKLHNLSPTTIVLKMMRSPNISKSRSSKFSTIEDSTNHDKFTNRLFIFMHKTRSTPSASVVKCIATEKKLKWNLSIEMPLSHVVTIPNYLTTSMYDPAWFLQHT